MNKKIGIASLIMMSSVVASRLIGLVREVAIAWAGGAGAQVDAYQIAFILPEILNHVVGSGFLSITFIPIFTKYLSQKNEDEGYRVFSIILNGFGGLLLVAMAFCMVYTPFLISLLAPGISDATTFDLAVRMTRIIIPAQFFFFSGGLFMAVQFAQEKFFIPALSPLIYNLGIILGGVLLFPLLGMEGFAWGVLGGAFAGSFLLQWFGARKIGLKYRFSLDVTHPDLKTYVLLTLPLMLGLTMMFSTEILLKFFGSFLDEGSIAAMNYAVRIMFILVGFFGQAVGMASFPFMAKIAATGNMEKLNELMNKTLCYIFISIPFSFLFMVTSHEIVLILFQRGRFDAQATALTAGILPFFLLGTFAFCAQTIVARGYYAVQNTLIPAIFSTLCVGVSLPCLYLLSQYFGVRALACGLTFTNALGVFALFYAWSRRTKNTGVGKVYGFFFKMTAMGVGLFVILWYIRQGLLTFMPNDTMVSALGLCMVLGVIFLGLFLGAAKIFHIEEITLFFHEVLSKILPRRFGKEKESV